jgi:tetratricopeptide (TPR) repeat protein
VWQKLQEELADTNFLVISVALESRGLEGALPWITPANPTYPCLIDREHEVARLYGMTNVPNAVWINEDGRIVRPVEPAGSTDGFRHMDLATRSMPPEQIAKSRDTRAAYLDGLRDWARRGEASPWALPPDEVRARMRGVTPEIALARAYFRLGEYLWEQGNLPRARANFDEAIRLDPDSWEYKRQAWDLEEQGKSMGPEFWTAVQALGDKAYYPEIQIPGR